MALFLENEAHQGSDGERDLPRVTQLESGPICESDLCALSRVPREQHGTEWEIFVSLRKEEC